MRERGGFIIHFVGRGGAEERETEEREKRGGEEEVAASELERCRCFCLCLFFFCNNKKKNEKCHSLERQRRKLVRVCDLAL